MLKDFGMMCINDTDINTPAAKLMKYATFALPQPSYLRIIKIPTIVMKQASELAKRIFMNMLRGILLVSPAVIRRFIGHNWYPN
jgi:hypothetical protein